MNEQIETRLKQSVRYKGNWAATKLNDLLNFVLADLVARL